MHVISVANVRQALPAALDYLLKHGRRESTRGGDVYAAQVPVAIRYKYPKQHVLINPVRDANPFFHLMEAMWMLAGRNDSAFLDRYVHDFGERYASHGVVMDAYGYRWKHALENGNQLKEIVKQLQQDHSTRQCVLQMWGAGREDLFKEKFKPCNLVATFRIVYCALNMVVHNRSNDLVWGACGANAVHFALLQEYIAEMVAVPMGEYWQVSDNLHVYVEHLKMLEKRAGDISVAESLDSPAAVYAYGSSHDLVTKPSTFDYELNLLLALVDNMYTEKPNIKMWPVDIDMENKFLSEVVAPMAYAHWLYKNATLQEALNVVTQVTADDWRRAGTEWLSRRKK